MITLQSDLKLSFEELGIKFHSMLKDNQDDLESLIRKAVDNFDFETEIKHHVNKKMHDYYT